MSRKTQIAIFFYSNLRQWIFYKSPNILPEIIQHHSMWFCIKNDFNNEIGIDCREYVLLMSIHQRSYFVSLIWHARLYHANQHNGITFLLSFLALHHYISCRVQNSGSMNESLFSIIVHWKYGHMIYPFISFTFVILNSLE